MDCCNENPMFQVGIFVKSRDSIFTICESINTKYRDYDCNIRIDADGAKIRFKNGSLISIHIAEESSIRYRRYHVALVENGVRTDIVYDYIAPWVIWKYPDVNIGGIVWA